MGCIWHVCRRSESGGEEVCMLSKIQKVQTHCILPIWAHHQFHQLPSNMKFFPAWGNNSWCIYFCCGSVFLKTSSWPLIPKITQLQRLNFFFAFLFVCFLIRLLYSKIAIYLITHLTMSESYFSFKGVCSQSKYLLSHNLWPEALQGRIINLILKRRVIYLLWQVRIIKNGGGKMDFWELTCCWWTCFSISPYTFQIMSNPQHHLCSCNQNLAGLH